MNEKQFAAVLRLLDAEKRNARKDELLFYTELLQVAAR